MKVKIYVVGNGDGFQSYFDVAKAKAKDAGHVYFVVQCLRIERDAFGYYFQMDVDELPVGNPVVQGTAVTRVVIIDDGITLDRPQNGHYIDGNTTATVTSRRIHQSEERGGTYDTSRLAVVSITSGRSSIGSDLLDNAVDLYNQVRGGTVGPDTAYVDKSAQTQQ
jgi:hypothetical protein